MGLQREVSTYEGQDSTQNAPSVVDGTPTRGLYLRRTVQQTKCPLCIGWDSNARSLLTEDNTAHKMPFVYWVGLQREVSTYEGQYSTQNAPCVLDGTPTRGLYLRRTIQHTKCPYCSGWDSNARSLLTEDNTANKMPLVYWMGLQREVSTYGGQYSTQNALCVLGGTPTRGLYLRRTIQHTTCPLCIGWDSNARSLLTEDNTAHKMPLV